MLHDWTFSALSSRTVRYTTPIALTAALAIAAGCSGKESKKAPPTAAPATVNPAAAAHSASATAPAAAQDQAPPSPGPDKVSLLDDGPGASLQVGGAPLTARIAGGGQDDLVELVWKQKVVSTCNLNLARASRVDGRRDGTTVYVVCESFASGAEVQKLTVADGQLVQVGSASIDPEDDTDIDRVHALPFEAPTKSPTADAPAEVARRWLGLITDNSKDAAIHSSFPLTVRSTYKHPPCAPTMDALEFHDSGRQCLFEKLVPMNHTAWKAAAQRSPKLVALGKGVEFAEVVSFHSAAEDMEIDVDVLIAGNGRVAGVLFATSLAE